MALWGNFFQKNGTSVALIDIGSGSVGGGYAHEKQGQLPTIEYAHRIPLERRGEESVTDAMLRALAALEERLIAEGIPALARATGSGGVHEAFVSLASPWQDTLVRIERVEEAHPFTFTHALVRDIVGKTTELKNDRVESGESVIATILNGYETSKPFGKKVKRADIVVLSSSIERTAVEKVEASLRATYHLRHPSITAFAPLAYGVFRDIYPHEKNFIVLDVSGEATDIALVKNGLLASVISTPNGVNHLIRASGTLAIPSRGTVADNPAFITARTLWYQGLTEALRAFAQDRALPRTLFLLSDEPYREYLRAALDDPSLRSLWLSDEPLSIIPVTPLQFAPFVASGPATEGDVFLMMLALFHGKHIDRLGA